MIPYNKKLVSTAQRLRREMTPEERHLWYDFLKKLPITVKRQHNIGNYIVDFYIPARKTVVEIDGIQHASKENRRADQERDANLAAWGITVLRYTNEMINNEFHIVVIDILQHFNLKFFDLKK